MIPLLEKDVELPRFEMCQKRLSFWRAFEVETFVKSK